MRRDQPHHRGAHDIDSRSQESGDLLDGLHRAHLGLRGVEHAVRAECQQSIDIVGGDDPGRLVKTAQLRGVAADLVRAMRVQSDESQIGAFDEHPQCVAAHVAGRELND